MRHLRTSRAALTIIVMTTTLILMLLVTVSPAVMIELGRAPVDWARLADIGQAYGGSSAILSGLALCGIAASLILQWRQTRLAQLYSLRQRHFELIKLALDDSVLLYVEGPEATADPFARMKVYANMTVSHWALCWDLGAMTADVISTSAARLFHSEIARDWWMTYWDTYAKSPNRWEFVEIVSTECLRAADEAAAEKPPAPHETGRPPLPESPRRRISRGQLVGIAVISAVIGAAVRRRAALPGWRRG